MTKRRNDPPGGVPPATDADTLDALRRTLSGALPGLLARAIDGYRQYVGDQAPGDPKAFMAYQAGCRAALSHIHLVLRLAGWAGAGGDDRSAGLQDGQAELLLREAEAALREEAMDDD